ncbi:MAG: hypothetical protein CMI53_02250 [Parcubacteria group bacterium]|nr:hypothetical protein [Parcubacteria group bacterium]|tara:strand:+ start:2688 stop:3125 length:438 start_codon:yes stop_codon:yes gene_type:complete
MARKKKQNLEIFIDDQDTDSLYDGNWLGSDNEGQLQLDVFQDNKNLYIKSTIAGVSPKDIEISMHNDTLTIRGSRKQEHEIEEKDYYFQECYWGNFSRSIVLPTDVQSDKISADLKNGVLTITLPKSHQRRNIPIKITDDPVSDD